MIGSHPLPVPVVNARIPDAAPDPRRPGRRSRTLAIALALGAVAFAQALASAPAAPPSTQAPAATVLLVVGAAGESEFGTNFLQQAVRWQEACRRAGIQPVTLGTDAPPTAPTNAPATTNTPAAPTDLDRLNQFLEAQPREGPAPLWLVLIGHGTFDGKEAKFNLRGPDLGASNLATVLKPFTRPTAVLNTAPASSPFLPRLAASNRVVIAATRSGYEQNFTRLGHYLAGTIADPEGDLDQDGQTSLLEAFLSASFKVAEFYKTEGRMATEHALIDDNGDGLGTPAEWFRGLRATRRAKDGGAVDGLRAHQFHLVPSPAEASLAPEARARRDELERQVASLRDERTALGDAGYFARLEPLLLEIARLYATPGPDTGANPGSTPR